MLLLPQLALFVLFPDRKKDDRMNTFYEVADELQAISLGSSHTRDLHFPSMGLRGYSLADDSGDIQIAELKMRLLDNYTPNLEFVFITISPGFLSYNRMAGVPESFPDDLLRYSPMPKSFSELDLQELFWLARSRFLVLEASVKELNKLTKEAIRTYIKGKNVHDKSGILCEFILNSPDHPHEDGIHDGFARTPVDASCITSEFEAADAQRRINSIDKTIEQTPDIIEKNTVLLRKIAENAGRLGAKLILVVSPTTSGYFEHPKMKEYWAKELPVIKRLTSLSNVILIDEHEYFYQYPYQLDNRWFSDANHVSFEGAKLFSKKIATLLKQALTE